MTIASGVRLGPYEVVSRLGAGGMGEVWRARDSRLHREAAIKVLPAEIASDVGRLRRFEREARAASALNHPNIVTIYDIGSSDSISYIAMELVEGRTLRALLYSGPLPVKRVLGIAAQVAEGLARAHEAGIVHRDLKPENVMVTKDGRAKILDFGLAKLTSTATENSEKTNLPTETATGAVVLGTAGYMSPEQASGQPLDFRSDQFSFGSILYELLTGKKAFQKKTAVETLAAVLNEEPEPVSAIRPDASAPLCWAVERCLTKEPDARYDSTKDLARELKTISAHFSEPITAAAATQPKRRRTPAWLVASAAIAMLAAGLLAGRWLWRTGAAPAPRFERVTYQKSNVRTASLSPDGQTIVYTAFRPNTGVGLFVTRPGNRESRSLGIANSDVLSISSSGEMVLVHDSDAGPVLSRLSVDGGEPRRILEGVAADWSPDGKNLAVVRRVGAKSRIEYPVGTTRYEQTQPIGLIRISPRGDRIAFMQSGFELAVVDRSGNKTALASNIDGFDWAPSGEEIWFLRAARGATEIRAVSLGGRERVLISLPGDFALHGISRTGRLLFERGEAQFDVLGRFPGDPNPHAYTWLGATMPTALSPDGKTLLFMERDPGWKGGVTYKRPTDGSPAVALGEGYCRALSPDGKWLVCREETMGGKFFLMATGPGENKTLPFSGLELRTKDGMDWLPDGSRIVFSANAPGRPPRIYSQAVSGGSPVAITAEGVMMSFLAKAVSPDGRWVVGLGPGGFSLYPVAGGKPTPIPGRTEADRPVQWTADGRSLYVIRHDRPNEIWLVDLESGRRRLWKDVQFSPPDPTAGSGLSSVLITPDGESYVYAYEGWLADLYVLDGLK